MSAQREQDRPQASAVIPVRPIDFIENFLKDITSPRNFAEDRDSYRRELVRRLTVVSNLKSKILTLWSSKGNLTISVFPEEAMKKDVKRKVYGLLETVREAMMNTVAELDERMALLESGVSVERRSELIEEVRTLLTELDSVLFVSILLLDDVLGILQVNLPADIMSNLIKVHMGFVTT